MATADSAAAPDGPRYAPDDPSLPKPWKGLIDGSSGVLYYWNQETNITQYERPAALPPPLPAGPPPVPTTPNLAPIPSTRMSQPNGAAVQHEHQMVQGAGQHGEVPHLSQSDAQQMSHVAHQGSQAGSAMQHPGQMTNQNFRPQLMQQANQQMFPFSDQQRPQQGNQTMQATHQMPQQMGHQTPMYQGANSGEAQNFQFPNQQVQYNAYQPNIPHHGQQHLPQQTQQTQGQQFSYQQEHKTGFSHSNDTDFQHGRQSGFPASHAKQSGVQVAQSPTSGSNSGPKPQMGVQPGQATQFGGPSFNMQQPAALAHLPQSTDLTYQQSGPRFPNQMDPTLMHGQHSSASTAGLKKLYEESPPGRVDNEYFSSANKDVHRMPPQQPKLAAIPMARNHIDTRMGGPLQHAVHAQAGPPNHGPPASQDIYNHPIGVPPFPRSPMGGPPSMVMGSPDAMNLSAAEVYRQKHEVTATGDNVPAPFMSFEATRFPQEILREVRYLLRRSICRTLHCYAHTYAKASLSFGVCKLDS